MWDVYAIDLDGECARVNEQPINAEEVGLLIDKLEKVVAIMLSKKAGDPMAIQQGVRQPETTPPQAKDSVSVVIASGIMD